jgi:hypothetical protein
MCRYLDYGRTGPIRFARTDVRFEKVECLLVTATNLLNDRCGCKPLTSADVMRNQTVCERGRQGVIPFVSISWRQGKYLLVEVPCCKICSDTQMS